MTAEATAAEPITFSRIKSMNASGPGGRKLRYGCGKHRLGRWVTPAGGKVSKGPEAALVYKFSVGRMRESIMSGHRGVSTR